MNSPPAVMMRQTLSPAVLIAAGPISSKGQAMKSIITRFVGGTGPEDVIFVDWDRTPVILFGDLSPKDGDVRLCYSSTGRGRFLFVCWYPFTRPDPEWIRRPSGRLEQLSPLHKHERVFLKISFEKAREMVQARGKAWPSDFPKARTKLDPLPSDGICIPARLVLPPELKLPRLAPLADRLQILADAIKDMEVHPVYCRWAKAIRFWALALEMMRDWKQLRRPPFMITNKDIVIRCHNTLKKPRDEKLLGIKAAAIKNTILEARKVGKNFKLPFELKQSGSRGVVVQNPSTATISDRT
jgi:hypothetical protein